VGYYDGIFTTGEEYAGILKLRGHFANYKYGFSFDFFQVI
jgi:hypothetical protein